MSTMERHEAARIFIERMMRQSDASFDYVALKGLKLDRTAPGRCIATLPVDRRAQNRYGTLHGGCIATLVDTIGSAALVTVSDKSGVSLSISVNYISALPGGQDAEVDARVVKVGQTIATIDVFVREKATGRLCAQGVHVKFLNVGEGKHPAVAEAEEAAKQKQLPPTGQSKL